MRKIFTFLVFVACLLGMTAYAQDPRYVYPEGARLETAIDDYHYRHKYFFAYKDGKVGIVDDCKRVMLPLEYDEVKRVNQYDDNYYVRQGNNWGIVCGDGSIVLPVVCKSIVYSDNDRYTVTEHDGTVFTIDDSDMYHMETPGAAGYLTAKYKCGPYFYLLLSKAKEVSVDRFWTSGLFSEGLLPVADLASNKIGFLDRNGNWAIPQKIPYVYEPGDLNLPAFSGGYLVIREGTAGGTRKYAVYDKTGQITFREPELPAGSTVHLSKFVEGGFALEEKIISAKSKPYVNDVRFRYITPEGKEIFPDIYKNDVPGPLDPDYYIRPMCDGRVAFTKDGRWGFFDKNGKVCVQPRYEQVHDFREGLAAVQMRSDEEQAQKWGFINTQGELVIPAKFSNEPSDFYEGCALVQKTNESYVYINMQGQVVSPEFISATPFVNGHAFVEISPAMYVTESFAVDHSFLPVKSYINSGVFDGNVKRMNDFVSTNDGMLLNDRGEPYKIWAEEDYIIQSVSENIAHLIYGNPRQREHVFCTKTGRVLFVLKLNEF